MAVLIRPRENSVRTEDGFTPDNDLFGKADLASRLINLYTALHQPTVSVLDGRWGVGKSTFIKMWQAESKKAGLHCIYIDSFSLDYIDSPFDAVTGSILDYCRKNTSVPKRTLRSAITSATDVSRILTPIAVRTAIKAATLGLIGTDEFDAFGKAGDVIADGAGDASKEIAESLLDKMKRHRLAFEKLSSSLSELRDSIYSSRAHSLPGNIVVVIDELDRCRPDFSLGVIECIKHFFRLEGFQFILVSNLDHLSLSVSHRYGTGEGAREYLDKFFDFLIPFDHNYRNQSRHSVSGYVERLTNRLLKDHPSLINIVDYISMFSCAYELSLREIEKLVTNVCLSHLASRNFPLMAIVFCCFLKQKEPSLYLKTRANKLRLEDIQALINRGNWRDDRHSVDRLFEFFVYCLADPLPEGFDAQSYGSMMFHLNFRRTDLLRVCALEFVESFGQREG